MVLYLLGGFLLNTISNVCPFDCTSNAGSGQVETVNRVDQTSVVSLVTPTENLSLLLYLSLSMIFEFHLFFVNWPVSKSAR